MEKFRKNHMRRAIMKKKSPFIEELCEMIQENQKPQWN